MIKVKCSRKQLKEILPNNRLKWSVKHKIYYDDALDYFIIEYWAKIWAVILTSPVLFLLGLYDGGAKELRKDFSNLFNSPLSRDTSDKYDKTFDKLNELEKINE